MQPSPLQKKLAVLEACPPEEAGFAESHIQHMDVDYTDQFSAAEIVEHVHLLSHLIEARPLNFLLRPLSSHHYGLTVVGNDFLGLLSIISALVNMRGFTIESAKVFTYLSYSAAAAIEASAPARKHIVDYLELRHTAPERLGSDMVQVWEAQSFELLSLMRREGFAVLRRELHTRMGMFLSRSWNRDPRALLSLDIRVENEASATLLEIKGSETPAFLFSMANLLAGRGYSIQKFFFRREEAWVHNLVFICDTMDRPISSPEEMENLRVAVALVQQFMLYLPVASNYDAAIRQFDIFLDKILSSGGSTLNILEIQDETVLASLARIFGTGPYLWEQFAKMQHEVLLPWLKKIDAHKEPKTREQFRNELGRQLPPDGDWEQSCAALNAYKDAELFRCDFLYITYPSITFVEFARELSDLAEVVIEEAFRLSFKEIAQRFGRPMVAGRPCSHAVCALGKLGGRELGYASDIELVIVFEVEGDTQGGRESTTTTDFYSKVVRNLKKAIQAKADGIFELDLRLRPNGDAGPLACSFRTWKQYYEPEGMAHDLERQALIKLRPIAGDPGFCLQILQARDSLLFRSEALDLEALRQLKHKQTREQTRPGKLNAKYSPGGLAELEYSVQYLQLLHGQAHPALRQQNALSALESLLEEQVISASEYQRLYAAYAFQRRLINALRMVRGNARDMEIPERESPEFHFLAKRLGYVEAPEQQDYHPLMADIRRHFSEVNSFFQARFEGKQMPSVEMGLPELLALDTPKSQEVEAVMRDWRFAEPVKAFSIMQGLHRLMEHRNSLNTWLSLSERHIRRCADPDKVLAFTHTFFQNCGNREEVLEKMVFHPRSIEILIGIFDYSDFLSNFLMREPELISELSFEAGLEQVKTREVVLREIDSLNLETNTLDDCLERLKRYQNREMIRIGLGDFVFHHSLESITRAISTVTDCLVDAVYRAVLRERGLERLHSAQAIVAMGKLGGQELNYSSDVDIVFITGKSQSESEESALLERVDRALLGALTKTTSYGSLFRVDTNLRPYGAQGALVGAPPYYYRYYEKEAHGWELQAWIKARCIAGNQELGDTVVSTLQKLLLREDKAQAAFKSILRIRERVLEQLKATRDLEREIKSGPGGIRTVEFWVQSNQIRHAVRYPSLMGGNTMKALGALNRYQLIPANLYSLLREGYLFLRTLEHRIQLLGFQQRHLLPRKEGDIIKLAKRMGFEDRLHQSALQQFLNRYRYVMFSLADISEQLFQFQERPPQSVGESGSAL